MTTPTPEHPALAAVRKSGSSKVKVAVSDIDGVLRGKYLHLDKFLGAAEPPGGGFGFCDVVFGWDCGDQYLRQHPGHRLAARLSRRAGAARPRHRSASVPWDGDVPFFLGEFVNADGTPVRRSARARR